MPMVPALRSALVLAAAALAAPAAPVDAQQPAPVPFAVGERMRYQVKLGAISVGSGTLQVLGTERVGGFLTYHTRMTVSGGVPLARVDDRFDSWIDVVGVFSRRFRQDVKEVRYKRLRTYEFYPERNVYTRLDNNETAPLLTDKPLDDLSFLYYARTLPLNVGETYTLNRYFKKDGNPVILRVVRRERIRVPAGTFNTIVVRPTIRTKGLFAEGGEAEVYFTDDARRIPVQIRTKVPVVGSLSMYLQQYTPGGS